MPKPEGRGQKSSPLTFDLTYETLAKVKALSHRSQHSSLSEIVRHAVNQFNFSEFEASRDQHRQVSIRLPFDLKVKLEHAAKRYGVSLGELLRVSLDDLMEKMPEVLTKPETQNTMAKKKAKRKPAKKKAAKRKPAKRKPAKKKAAKRKPAKKKKAAKRKPAKKKKAAKRKPAKKKKAAKKRKPAKKKKAAKRKPAKKKKAAKRKPAKKKKAAKRKPAKKKKAAKRKAPKRKAAKKKKR